MTLDADWRHMDELQDVGVVVDMMLARGRIVRGMLLLAQQRRECWATNHAGRETIRIEPIAWRAELVSLYAQQRAQAVA